MAKTFKKITSDDKLWLSREGDSYSEPIKFLLHTPEGVRESAVLSTYEIGLLAAHLVLVYFERTRRVIWPVAGSILKCYEQAKIDAEQEMIDWLKTSPDPENRARGEAQAATAAAVVETKPQCPHCDEFGECTGDCL